MIQTATAYWLVVVRADRPDLYAKTRRAFEKMPLVEVILDRRRSARRQADSSVPVERRRNDRRRSGTRPPADGNGYRLIHVADGFQVFQAAARLPVNCSDCGAGLEFEMPRFTELPARLDVEVIHMRVGMGAGASHVVEAQAFRASGRPFLACRLFARRRSG